MKHKETKTLTVGGVKIDFEFNDLSHADSCLVKAGDTVVFVSAIMSDKDTSLDYFPLTVDFEEKFYSVGKILGSRFMRREGRPSQDAVLNGRIIDRTIRPLFPKELKRETQVVATTLSFGEYNPDVLSIIGTSVVLGKSNIPFNGPVSAIRYTKSDNGWVPFIDFKEGKNKSSLLICGKDDVITMIEMEGEQIPEAELEEVTKMAMEDIKAIQNFQRDVTGIGEKIKLEKVMKDEKVEKLFKDNIESQLKEAIFNDGVDVLKSKWSEVLKENEIENDGDVFEDTKKQIIRDEILDNKKRVGGRALDEIRELYIQVGGVSKKLHGSGLFYRGDTHILTILTLGGASDAMLLDNVENPNTTESFYHHYNFPPYATGEVGRIGTTKRRELGHGALAEKALRYVLPSQEEFPYTIRLVSETFSSDGSTSMASVCGSTIALMDGGVPITSPVAGISIGLVTRGDDYALLQDIQALEDYCGDMDLKIAGTEKGITAIQMDVKIDGITFEMFSKSLVLARDARMKIIDVIKKELPTHRNKISEFAPSIKVLKIDPKDIGMVIGSGGSTIKKIREDSGIESIDIEDDGTVLIFGSESAVEMAYAAVSRITKGYEVGEEYDVKIVRVVDFGAFAELDEKKDGLIHISEISTERIPDVAGYLKVGDVVPVVVKDIENGKIALSIKDRDPDFFKNK